MPQFVCELRQYNPDVYANLHELEAVKPQVHLLSQATSTLGEVIRRHGLQQYVGVALLHKHFRIYTDERLVRHFGDNEMRIAPHNGGQPLIPFIWAFCKTKVDESFGCYPVEFIGVNIKTDFYAQHARVVESNTIFINEFYGELARQGVTGWLGLGLIVGLIFEFAADEELVETENSSRERALTMRPIKRENIPTEGADVIQTLWMFQ